MCSAWKSLSGWGCLQRYWPPPRMRNSSSSAKTIKSLARAATVPESSARPLVNRTPMSSTSRRQTISDVPFEPALTRDDKEVINVQTAGGCIKKPRVFDNDSSYSFDATETEPPNTNSIFGTGGDAVWASDNAAQRVRGCIIISSGLGSDISRCVDMAFQ
jgi:hypothetical protein